ncbi:MAG: hypothetical protein ACRDIY_17325 [Chloroflexota bacterium]
MIRADVKCYHCGHISGQVEGDPDNPRLRWHFRPGPGGSTRPEPERRLIRCARCGGPVFLDDVESIRSRPYAFEQRAASTAE